MWFLHEVTGYALCCLAHRELARLFHEPHTGLEDCLNMVLPCFRKMMPGVKEVRGGGWYLQIGSSFNISIIVMIIGGGAKDDLSLALFIATLFNGGGLELPKEASGQNFYPSPHPWGALTFRAGTIPIPKELYQKVSKQAIWRLGEVPWKQC